MSVYVIYFKLLQIVIIRGLRSLTNPSGEEPDVKSSLIDWMKTRVEFYVCCTDFLVFLDIFCLRRPWHRLRVRKRTLNPHCIVLYNRLALFWNSLSLRFTHLQECSGCSTLSVIAHAVWDIPDIVFGWRTGRKSSLIVSLSKAMSATGRVWDKNISIIEMIGANKGHAVRWAICSICCLIPL